MTDPVINPETGNAEEWSELSIAEKKSPVCTGMKRLFFMPDGSFSITRITMLLSAETALILLWVAFIIKLIWKIDIPDNIYTFMAGFTGGSFLQYGFVKYTNPDTTKSKIPYEESKNIVMKAIQKLVFDSNGAFSSTRIIMIQTMASSLILFWWGVIMLVVTHDNADPNKFTFASNYLGYMGALCGSGIFQYGATKIISNITDQNKPTVQ